MRATVQSAAPEVGHGSPLFGAIDAILRFAEPLMPSMLRRRAIDAAVSFIRERLNGEAGLGAIFPAMANAVMAFDTLGYAEDHPDRRLARAAIDRLLVVKEGEAYCQPCVSPVWDTALACHALMETGAQVAMRQAARGLEWLKPLQVLETAGDWAARRRDVKPGGWAFQYANPHYPDLGRYRGRGDGHGSGGRSAIRSRDRPGTGVGRRTAEQQWRLGGVRCRQHRTNI